MGTYSRRTFLKYSAVFTSTAIAGGISLGTGSGGRSLSETSANVERETPIGRGANHPFFAGGKNRPEVIAHQGGKGQWPAETIFAFEQATKLGVDVLEFDLHSTRDGHLVLMHNTTVDETTNGTGRLNQLSLNDLKKLDAGYRWTADGGRTFPYRGKKISIATLAEVFEQFPGTRMNIEIKQSEPSIVPALCTAIEKHNMVEKVLVASFSNRDLELFRARCPDVATSASAQELLNFRFGTAPFVETPSRPDCLQVKDKILSVPVITSDAVARAHDLNLPLHAWTVNDIEGMKRMIALGVDGILTDYPGRLLALVQRGQHAMKSVP